MTISGKIMSKDKIVAVVENGLITSLDANLAPLYLKRTKDVEGWLASRAIDTHRANSRLLKKALRLKVYDDAKTALAVNAATITDNYWFCEDGSDLKFNDVKFTENAFDKLALFGDPNSFNNKPSRTPELTNTGSFEKCWRLIDNSWWMYKNESEQECFSELFISKLGGRLGFNMARYEMDGKYIKTLDFTNSAKVNFESIEGIIGEDEDYNNCFNTLYEISPTLAQDYLKIIWLDTVCFNMDRHTKNFGVLRDVNTGEILSLAPNYDNNIALISRGYQSDITRQNDALIIIFDEFINENEIAKEMLVNINIAEISPQMIDECLDEIPLKVDREFIQQFILNGQQIITQNINKGQEPTLSINVKQ